MGKRIKLSELSCEYVDAQARTIDWEAARGDDAEGWQSWEANACEGCGAAVVLSIGDGNDIHRRVDDENDHCEGHVSLAEGPMMSYWYPCNWGRYTEDSDDAARRIAHLPVCLIEFQDGEMGLALTGGGQDLSWEIAEAYILLGYLPPLAYAGDLPAMKAYTKERLARMRLVLSAARKSLAWMRSRVGSMAERVARAASTLAESEVRS